MLSHMKEQKGRGVRFGRIFLVCFSRGDDKKCIKKIHRWRANSRAVFRAHEMGENLLTLFPSSSCYTTNASIAFH